MATEQAISFPIADLDQLKIILASWYNFLSEEESEIGPEKFREYLKTPVFYNMGGDQVEVLFCGTPELLAKFKQRYSK